MPEIRNPRPAGPHHQVVEVHATTRAGAYRREPCEECPWRKDAPVGAFPAEAYRHSARTAFDSAKEKFSCHMSGTDKPQACAGFLLSNSANNLAVRLAAARGQIDLSKVSARDHQLYRSYREMAIANGVPADDPAIAPCRGDDESWLPVQQRIRTTTPGSDQE